MARFKKVIDTNKPIDKRVTLVPYTAEEEQAANAADLAAIAEQQRKASSLYLEKRKGDPDHPSQAEQIEALWDAVSKNDRSKLNAIQARLDALAIKYPRNF